MAYTDTVVGAVHPGSLSPAGIRSHHITLLSKDLEKMVVAVAAVL